MDTEQMERVIATYMNNCYFRDLVESVPELYKAARTFWENTYKYFCKVFEGDYYDIDGSKWFARDALFEERLVQYTNLMHYKVMELINKVLREIDYEEEAKLWARLGVIEDKEMTKLYCLSRFSPSLARYYASQQEVSYACY